VRVETLVIITSRSQSARESDAVHRSPSLAHAKLRAMIVTIAESERECVKAAEVFLMPNAVTKLARVTSIVTIECAGVDNVRSASSFAMPCRAVPYVCVWACASGDAKCALIGICCRS
jgi:hypothetical protein